MQRWEEFFLCVALNITICHKKKQRYKIEAKNAELKQSHGFQKCKFMGLFGMKITFILHSHSRWFSVSHASRAQQAKASNKKAITFAIAF